MSVPSPKNMPTVLVVDDELLIRTIARDALEGSGFRVIEAENGQVALDLVQSDRPDIVLLDIVMPVLDGFETCRQLRQMPEGKGLPVMVMTRLDDSDSINQAYEAGATDFTSKPINWTILAHHMRYIIRASAAMQQLRVGQRRLVNAQRIAHIGNWEWEVRGDRLDFFGQVRKILGKKIPIPTTGKEFIELVHPQDRPMIQSALRRTFSRNVPLNFDCRIRNAAGDEQTLHMHAEVVADEIHKTRVLLGTIQDISERKQIERSLREEQNFVEKILNTAGALVVVLDPQGRIERINRAGEQLGQYRSDEVVGKSLGEVFFLEEERAALADIFQRLLDGEELCQHESHWIAKDGVRRLIAWSDTQLRNTEGQVTHIIATGVDITARKRAEEQIFKLGNFDSLTGLPNRYLFSDRLDQAIRQAARRELTGAVMLLDLDRFKRINDTFGHLSGDYLLMQVGERLRQCLRESDSVAHLDTEDDDTTIARLGGDEFSILLSEVEHIQDAAKVAQRLLQVLKEPCLLPNGQEVALTASIGISIFPTDGRESGELLQFADVAMYHAKQQGGDSYQFYATAMNATALQSLVLENDLRQGLERGEFVLYYQPQVDLASGRIVSLEALARWRHPKQGLVPPSAFIPIASETGLIDDLVGWSLETACAQMRQWRDMGLTDLRVAVNVPSRHFLQDDLPGKVKRLLERHDLDGSFLELEITEDSVMSQEESSIETLISLKELGIELSIDDFGTGYSSLSYLNRFPLDTLKVDQSFLRGVPDNHGDCSLVKAIISMAHGLGLKVVAEGVETIEQLEFIRETRCEKIQGYYFSRPVPVEDVNRLLLGEVDLPPFSGVKEL